MLQCILSKWNIIKSIFKSFHNSYKPDPILSLWIGIKFLSSMVDLLLTKIAGIKANKQQTIPT